MTQALIGLGIALGLFGLETTEVLERAAVGDTSEALSASLATLAVVLPNAYYAWVSERSFNANRLLAQGVMRMVLAATLVAVCIVVVGIAPMGFFATLIAMQFAYLNGQTRSKR